MTEEERLALREEEKDARKKRRRGRLKKVWRTLCWGIAPLCAAWLVFLVILMLREHLYGNAGELLVCALLALPALALLPAAVLTLLRAAREKERRGTTN
ncbi:MAG: hypothetical protein IKS31_12515 [Clostridia bacterium]|nr:hypothetical protein [Clostridia bacterium]MBR4459774.1 hypothetical protein [Clostridia bacterium]